MNDPMPLPPELASPEPDADAWVEQMAEAAVALAEDAAMDADAAGYVLASPPADSENYAARVLLPEPAKRWTITDDGSAEWAMRHVVAAQAELDRLAFQASEWQDRIAAWFDHGAKPLRATRAFMEAHLERYAQRVREETDGKRKSVVLPSGVVRTTSKSPRVVVLDEPVAIAWADKNAPDAVARDPRLRVSMLPVNPRKLVTEARLTLSCGCAPVPSHPQGLDFPAVGSEVECEDHGPVLLGRVDVLATRWVLDKPVPGLDVDPGGVTAKVVPAP